MMIRRWKLTAAYLSTFALGIMTAATSASLPALSSLSAASVAVGSGTGGPPGAIDLATVLSPLPSTQMSATVGAGWDFWGVVGDFFGAAAAAILELGVAVLILYGFVWLCTRDNVSCA